MSASYRAKFYHLYFLSPNNYSFKVKRGNPHFNNTTLLVLADSLVILEYIDETWTSPPRLLPEDPYQRARVQFWAAYFDPLLDDMRTMVVSEGKALQKAIDQMAKKLDTAEEEMKEIFHPGSPLVGGKTPGYLDVVAFSVLGSHRAAEEVLGAKLQDPERHPQIFSWVEALNELPLIKETALPHSRMVELLQFIRQKYLKPHPV